jgi:hypothetical protein
MSLHIAINDALRPLRTEDEPHLASADRIKGLRKIDWHSARRLQQRIHGTTDTGQYAAGHVGKCFMQSALSCLLNFA